MISQLKRFIFIRYYCLKAYWYRLKGIQIGKKSIISGFPEIRKAPGSKIILGDKVTLHSKHKYNTLIRHPFSMATITKDAVIELKYHCGLSGCKIQCAHHIVIGEYTIVGPDTIIYDCKQHEYNPKRGWYGRTKVSGASIIIGKYCYIGMRCIILKGVTIGDHCVIAAGTIITKDVPAGHLAQGNPAVYIPLPARLGGADT